MLDDIANYQNYADNAKFNVTSVDSNNNSVLVSAEQIDKKYYVVAQQIRKKQNELSFKTMYFENGILDDKAKERIMKI